MNRQLLGNDNIVRLSAVLNASPLSEEPEPIDILALME